MKEITERRLTVEKRKDINEEFYENCNIKKMRLKVLEEIKIIVNTTRQKDWKKSIRTKKLRTTKQ